MEYNGVQIAPFHERLNEALEIKNISRSELSRRTGLNRQVLYQYSKGIVTPRMNNIKLIADAINVAVTFLMGFDVDINGEHIEQVVDVRKNNPHANNLNKAMGLAMKQLRTSKHITLDELASKLGRSPQTLQAFENNEKQILALTLVRYCKYMDYDIKQLMEDVIFIFDELENEK